MNTTVSFNYNAALNYATELFKSKEVSYSHDKKLEALLILIGIDTGLRVSDLLKLKFSSISTENEYGKPLLTTWIAKKKRMETKPLSTTTNRLVETFYNYCLYNYTTVSEFIFFNYKNEKTYSRQWAHKRLNLANDAGELGKKVAVAGAHSLRRTAGHHIYNKTKDLRDVQFLLGHDRLKQSEEYLKLDQAQALDRLTALYN